MKAQVIFVVGPPGAGKGSICQRIAKTQGLLHISVGDLCREHVAQNTEYGKKIAAYVKAGTFAPDEILLDLLSTRLNKKDAVSKGVLLDGFPRTVKQAQSFLTQGIANVQRVLLLEAPDELCVERILTRRIDAETHEIYNDKTLPAPKNRHLVQRDGDKDEKRTRHRLEVFHKEIAKILSLFQGKIQAVNSARPLNEIVAEVGKVLSQPAPNQRDGKAEHEDDGGWGEEEQKRLAEARLLDDEDGIDITAAPCGEIGSGSTNIGVTIQVADRRERIPIDICCVVDISGSMSSDAKFQDPNDETKEISEGFSQLDIVKHSVKTVIYSLNREDRVSIVAFDSHAETVFALDYMTEDARKQATEALESLAPRGSTNIWAGLQGGLDSLRDRQVKDGVFRRSYVFLLTDGQPTESPPEGEAKSLATYLDSHPDFECQVNTFGFGYQLNSTLLHGIAVIGKGTFGFIPDAKIVGPCFVSATANALSALSQTCLVHLSPKNGTKFSGRVLGDYPVIETSWGRVVRIGALQYGQPRDLVCPVQIPRDLPANTPYLTITVEYANPLGGPHRKVSRDITNREVSSDAIAAFVRGLVVGMSMEVLSREDEKLMKTLVDSVAPFAKRTAKDPRIIGLHADVSGRMSKAISTKERFKRWGKHYLYAVVRAHQLQVRTNILDPGLQVYGGSAFKRTQSLGEETFKSLPMKKSNESRTRTVSTVQQAPVDNSTYYGGGCFVGCCRVLTSDGAWKQAADIRKGDILAVPGQENSKAVVKCVVRILRTGQQVLRISSTKSLGGLMITGGHPILLDGQWTRPRDVTSAVVPKSLEPEYLYNFVLTAGHVLCVEGIECCTFGHGLSGPVISHSFYGTSKVLDLLASLKGWENGEVTVDQSLHQIAKNHQL